MATVLSCSVDPLTSPARPAAGLALCRLDEIAPMQARRFLFAYGDEEFRGLLVHTRQGVRGYANWCPHMSVPLQRDDEDLWLEEDVVVCPWHRARFSAVDGRALTSPRDGDLAIWPVTVDDDGWVRTV